MSGIVEATDGMVDFEVIEGQIDDPRALLYDAGPHYTESADAGARIVAPFLRAAGVRQLDLVVVWHADSDNSGGLASVVQAVRNFLSTNSLYPLQ